VRLLQAQGFSVTKKLQNPDVFDGFLSFVPKELALFYVWAKRIL
jgi:hypothetical protein